MKTRSVCLLAASCLLFSLNSNASITGVNYQADGDGAITCPVYTWTGQDNVGVYGDQYWGPGHILFNVTTDTEQDPTLTLANSIDNDTSFSWTGYEVDVIMNKTFTISSAAITTPGDWTVSSVLQPGAPVGGNYTGHLFFSGGTPVAIGASLDFSYNVSFLGGVSFTEQLVPIPEPATLSLLLGGVLLVGGWRAARRR